MPKHQLIIATRESPLALSQANWVKNRLKIAHPHLTIRLLGLTTEADQRLSLSLSTVGGKGLFVKELEEALLDQRADIAVHSMKDVPMELPEGLCLPVITERENPHDVLVSRYRVIQDLPLNARVGTSSLRRESQLKALRPDLLIMPLRGNVNTRLKRLQQGDFDALVLAAAGLNRLALAEFIGSQLTAEEMLPAAGQGALGIECRKEDAEVQALISVLNHPDSAQCVIAERAVCKRLGGGCQVPLAAFAELIASHHLKLRGLVASLDGKRIIRAEAEGDAHDAEQLGLVLAEKLLSLGAGAILTECAKTK